MTAQHKGWESALVAAQAKITPVAKESTNHYHKYQYASAEDVIVAARAALNSEGLAVIRAWTITHDEHGSWVHSQFSIVHSGSTGVFNAGTAPFPIVEDKGRPVDKALAGALTTSLGYFLRDLLLIPKCDDDQMDKRDDSKYEPRGKQQSQNASAPIGLAGATVLSQRLDACGQNQFELAAAIEAAIGTKVHASMSKWESAWMPRIDVWLAARDRMARQYQAAIDAGKPKAINDEATAATE